MADKTVAERARRQRDVRVTEGWREVKVWVPTEADAEDIRKLAAERRKLAEVLHGLSREVRMIDIDTELRIAKAISEQGSAAYTTESGAVLELMTQLADEGDLQGLSRAFVILARAKPPNAAFVAGRVPAKITNFLVRHRRVDAAALLKWTFANPAWDENLKDALRDPVRFEQLVEEMTTAINHAAAVN